jgi:hypothetical protein
MPESFSEVLARSSFGVRSVSEAARLVPSTAVRGVYDHLRALDRSLAPGSTTTPRRSAGGAAYSDRTSHSATTRAEVGGLTAGKESAVAGRRTSAKAAKAASKVLRDGRTGKTSKTAAGSALSQRAKGGKRK